VRAVANNPKDPVLERYLVKHQVTHIPDDMFTTVGLGMMDVVDHGTGTVAKMDGIEVCAKTGTVENYAMLNGVRTKLQNHSMFVAFAPRVNPKIAIAVTVENAGYGATWAGPVASLMIEKYLNDTIATKRLPLEEKMLKGNVINYRQVAILDSTQRANDRLRQERRAMEAANRVAQQRYRDSVQMMYWVNKYLLKKKN
jgi:penicillin-binding protein 2